MKSWLFVALCFAPLSVAAETVERVVWGDVVNVEPVVEARNVAPPPDCSNAGPASADLLALLAWDLRRDCVRRSSSRISGYRVEYRWDGRTYSRLMDAAPGKRVPLLVKFK